MVTEEANSDNAVISPYTGLRCAPGVQPDVMTFEDIAAMVPALASHRKLVERVMHWLRIDEVNRVHGSWAHTSGIPFTHHLVDDEFKFKLHVDNEEVLARFPEGPFITVSNHPFGAMDGILLLHLVGKYREDFQVMVNMFLNHLSAMRSAFIAVDPFKSDDPEKKKTTMQGIRTAMKHLKEGHPLGFFPAGAVSKPGWNLQVRDREWQPSITRLIKQMRVPVIPIYFHGHNSWFFQFLGMIDWRLRSARLPIELFRRKGKKIHISVGNPIPVDVQDRFADPNELGQYLRQQTYNLRKIK